MQLSDLTEAEFSRVTMCIHEAAHALMAAVSGARIAECYASAEDGRVTLYEDHDPRTLARIAWSGVYAEALFVHGGDPSAKVLENYLADASEEDRTLMRGQRVFGVEADVRRMMPAIHRLAARLYVQGFATNAEVQVALGRRPDLDMAAVRHYWRTGIDPATVRLAGAVA